MPVLALHFLRSDTGLRRYDGSFILHRAGAISQFFSWNTDSAANEWIQEPRHQGFLGALVRHSVAPKGILPRLRQMWSTHRLVLTSLIGVAVLDYEENRTSA